MVSDCSGGTITVLACSPPPRTARPGDECAIERVAPCTLVQALHRTDDAIKAVQGALK